MPLRSLINDTSFPPETLAVIYSAFDLGWAEISAAYGDDQARAEFARTRLAQAVLAEAGTESRDPVRLKDLALRAFSRMTPPG
ncbi:MAG: hypothetical protein AB7J30_11205 [Hyphomicrobium sp.]|uniref:hypothetical protein n=1 Tax=Hyphomicrobium sp. TaxID=82 RepID=UPI003D1169FD